MTLDYSEDGAVKIDMREYIDAVVNEFPYKLGNERRCPWTERLFKVDSESKRIDPKRDSVTHVWCRWDGTWVLSHRDL